MKGIKIKKIFISQIKKNLNKTEKFVKMNQQNPTGPQLSQENVQLYNKMKQEYAQIFKIFIELEDEKREHSYDKPFNMII